MVAPLDVRTTVGRPVEP